MFALVASEFKQDKRLRELRLGSAASLLGVTAAIGLRADGDMSVYPADEQEKWHEGSSADSTDRPDSHPSFMMWALSEAQIALADLSFASPALALSFWQGNG